MAAALRCFAAVEAGDGKLTPRCCSLPMRFMAFLFFPSFWRILVVIAGRPKSMMARERARADIASLPAIIDTLIKT